MFSTRLGFEDHADDIEEYQRFSPEAGDTIICASSGSIVHEFGIYSGDLTGSVLYAMIRKGEWATRRRSGRHALCRRVELNEDPGELRAFLDILCSTEHRWTDLTDSLSIWKAVIVARLSPKLGRPSLTAVAIKYLRDIFCALPDQVPHLFLDNFAVAAAVVDCAETPGLDWLLPGSLAWCAQYSISVMHSSASLRDPDPPTARKYSLSPRQATRCHAAHGRLMNARRNRCAALCRFSAPLLCAAQPTCRTKLLAAGKEMMADPLSISALSAPSQALRDRFEGLCPTCALRAEDVDRLTRARIWVEVPELFGEDRDWATLRKSAADYIQGLGYEEYRGTKRKATIFDVSDEDDEETITKKPRVSSGSPTSSSEEEEESLPFGPLSRLIRAFFG